MGLLWFHRVLIACAMALGMLILLLGVAGFVRTGSVAQLGGGLAGGLAGAGLGVYLRWFLRKGALHTH